MRKMIIMVGNIASGKSILTKTLTNDGYVSISKDGLRYSIGGGEYVFDERYEKIIKITAQDMALDFATNEVNMVIDETNMSKDSRRYYINLAKAFGYQCIAMVMPKYSKKHSVDTRLRDNHGNFSRKKLTEVYEMFDSMYEEPTIEEGFDEIIMVKKSQ